MLQVNNLTKEFGGLRAVSNLNFDVKKGDIVGLIGPNGAGKTTVFNLITGFYKPINGNVIYDGHNITGKKPSTIAALGLARTFQSNLLFNDQSCFQNVMIAHHLQRKSNFVDMLFNTRRDEEEKIRCHTEEILDQVGLIRVRNQLAGGLVQGFKRALGIAIALATNPKLLLLDEPASGMTRTEIQAMSNFIQQLNSEGLTIVVVEHNMGFIMDMSERIIVLNFGRKLAEGRPEEIRSNKDVIEAYIGR